MQLRVKDKMGEFYLSYEEIKKYHGSDFVGGVAMAYKLVEAVVDLTTEDKVLNRNDFIFMSAIDAPGIFDGIEHLTRAITQKRYILKKDLNTKAPKAPNGYYSFRVIHNNKTVNLTLKDGLLADKFEKIASKCRAGIATKEELIQWDEWKKGIEDILTLSKYENIFTFEVI